MTQRTKITLAELYVAIDKVMDLLEPVYEQDSVPGGVYEAEGLLLDAREQIGRSLKEELNATN